MKEDINYLEWDNGDLILLTKSGKKYIFANATITSIEYNYTEGHDGIIIEPVEFVVVQK